MHGKGGAEESRMHLLKSGALSAALVLTLFTGQLLDKTTGQPLAGVRVSGSAQHRIFTATTNGHGIFHLQLPAGKYSLHFSSADVPPQERDVTVKGHSEREKLRACSTTLDYSCGDGGPGGA